MTICSHNATNAANNTLITVMYNMHVISPVDLYPDIKIATCMYMALSLCFLMRALATLSYANAQLECKKLPLMFNRTCDPLLLIAFPVNRKRCTHLPLANNNMYAPSKPDQEIAPNYAIRNTDPLHTLFNRMHEKHFSLPVNKEWNSPTPSAYHTMYAPTYSNCYLRKRTRYARSITNTASNKNTTNRPECKKHKRPKCTHIKKYQNHKAYSNLFQTKKLAHKCHYTHLCEDHYYNATHNDATRRECNPDIQVFLHTPKRTSR